jgi:hypothetical protein
MPPMHRIRRRTSLPTNLRMWFPTGAGFLSLSSIRQYLQAGLLDEIQLAISPILLGQGESLLEDIDLTALGYRVKEYVSTEAAMHLVVGR